MMRRVAKQIVLASLAIGLHATAASAGTFIPMKPAVCGQNYTTVNWDWHASYWRWDVPKDPYCTGSQCDRYIDNLKHTIHMVGNKWTTTMYMHFNFFDIETSYDKLVFGNATWTGNMGAFWAGWDAPANKSMHSSNPNFTFTTDGSIGRYFGISTDMLSVCSNRATEDSDIPIPMDNMDRHVGILLGKDDTVFLRTFGGAGIHPTFALWSPVENADFDLYVRCGALPTTTTYDYVGYSNGVNEFIHYDSTCLSDLYVAVHSYNGSGSFNLTKNQHATAQDRVLTAGTSWVVPANDTSTRATIENQLRDAARMFYGQTEGNWMIKQIDLYNNGNCNNCGGQPCGICFKNVDGRSNATCNGRVEMFQNHGGPEILSHELGHYLLCVWDQYTDKPAGGSNFQCGHTRMANAYNDSNNNHCTDLDHKFDADPEGPATTLDDVWDTGAGLIMSGADRTFDNYSYQYFTFADKVGLVVRK